MAPTNNRGMTDQTNEKHLNYLTEYFVREVKLAGHFLNNVFYFISFTNNHPKCLSNWTMNKTLCYFL
jgi:hypothetical protein